MATNAQDDLTRMQCASAAELSGAVIKAAVGKSLSHHEYEFKSKEDLARALKRHFAHVLVFENISSDQFEQRHNLYFYASDGQLPFDLDWPSMVRL